MVALSRACAVSFAVLFLLCLFSRFSSSDSKGGTYGREQISRVCHKAARQARFHADAALQDESLVMCLLHSCEAKAQASTAKDLAEHTGVQLNVDVLELHEDMQEAVDILIQKLHLQEQDSGERRGG